jgi:enoyl-CoA hydratase/carnithine racemase
MLEHHGSRLEIHLARPEKRNALTAAMYATLADAFVAAEAEDDIRSVLLAGRGDAFCAGNDLHDFLQAPAISEISPVLRFLQAISTSTKVVIAAIQGPAVGIGATMLLHCDHVVAASDSVLRFPFAAMGLVPEAASSLLLPAAIGHLKAAELLFTGDPLGAKEAQKLGLVSRVVLTGEQLDAARGFAGKLEKTPSHALRATKKLLRSRTSGVAERIAEESAVFRERLASPEFRAIARQFLHSSPSS